MPDYSQYLKKDDDDGPAHEPKRPMIFLVLAAVMMLAAIAVYTFEAEFYHLFGKAMPFVVGLTLLVALGLIFLLLYATPGVGNRVLGRSKPRPKVKRAANAGGVTYNVFQGESLGDVKMAHRQRKSARHRRKELARITPSPAELAQGKSAGELDEPAESDEAKEPDDGGEDGKPEPDRS